MYIYTYICIYLYILRHFACLADLKINLLISFQFGKIQMNDYFPSNTLFKLSLTTLNNERFSFNWSFLEIT